MTDSYQDYGYINARSYGGYNYGGSTGDGYNDNSNGANPYSQSTAYSLEDIQSVDATTVPVMFNQSQYSYEYINGEYVTTLTGTIPVRLAGSLCSYCDVKEGMNLANMNLMNSKFQYGSGGSYSNGPPPFAYRNNITDMQNADRPL